MNRIVKGAIELMENGYWKVSVTKEFSAENGGGEQTFTESGGVHIHRAVDVLREMVTVSPAQRTHA